MRKKLKQTAVSLTLVLGMVAGYLAFLAPPLTPYPVEVLDLGNDADDSGGLAAVQAAPPSAWREADTRRLSFLTTTSRTVWLHVRIPPSERGRKLVAEIATPYLKTVDFYVLEYGQIAAQSAQGMERPFAGRPYHFLTQALAFTPGDHTELYVRATSQLVLYLPLALIDEATYASHQPGRISLLAAFFGVYSGLLLYNLFVLVRLRDLANLYCAFYQLAMFFAGFLLSGEVFFSIPYLAEHFAVDSRCTMVALALTGVGLTLFLRELAGLKRVDPWAGRAIIGYCCLCFLVQIPVVLLAPLWVAAATTVVVQLLGGVTIWLGSLFRGHSSNEFYLHLALSGLGVGTCLALLTWMGVVPVAQFGELSIIPGGIWQALCISGVLTNRIRLLQEERQQIIQSLKSEQPASQLNGLFKKAYVAVQHEVNVSVMFIDIVGFSQLGKLVSPREVLQTLQALMSEMTNIVEEHGGIVDRSLGDGILCFFGYTNRVRIRPHASEAFAAAKRIQYRIAELALQTPLRMKILPVRIGIHVDEVLIGDLGGKGRIDFTMIGNGVNFASRLETACSPFKIMISAECRARLPLKEAQDTAFNEILVAVKHVDHLVRAFEYDPFADNEELLKTVQKQHMEQLKLFPTDRKFTLEDASDVTFVADIGTFRVVDFSAYGFRTLSDVYVGQKVTLLVRMQTQDEATNRELQRLLLASFHIEVRWGRKTADGFEHGFKTSGLTPEQGEKLFAMLQGLSTAQVMRFAS